MNKILIISGPTATGKTKLALQLAKLFDGELISADSRQVYKYMDVVTGKDIPKKFKIQNSKLKINNQTIPFYSDGRTKLWGYDLVIPDGEWSAAHFVKMARKIIANIWQRQKLPIVVGGTGLYIKNLLHPPETLFISPDKKLRQQLGRFNRSQLQAKLQRVNPQRFSDMNESDRQNPRRLIRALEIAMLPPKRVSLPQDKETLYHHIFHIGLTVNDKKKLYQRIDHRVETRIGKKLKEELTFLLRKDFLRHAPSVTIGYRQLMKHLDGEITIEEAVQRWKYAEHRFAGRQLTWFRKQPGIVRVDITDSGYPQAIVAAVEGWYDGGRSG